MTFLDRIAECNRHDLDRFVPFAVAGERVGWIRRDRLAWLAAHAPCLQVSSGEVALARGLRDFGSRSVAVAALVEALTREGVVPAMHAEAYPVATSFSAPPLLQLDRSAVPYFGVAAYGIHVNGWVRSAAGPALWIARRARDKPTYPGMLDNIVAGGQPLGITLHDNLLKECAEEASIPAALAATARPVGAVAYCHETERGLKPDCLFCYDLELPEDFAPRAADGEVEAFELVPVAKVAEIVHDSTAFKPNCNLVVIDFLVRHGFLRADDPDYFAVVRGLRTWAGR